MSGPAGRDTALEGIALVGMACRFPGARNLDELWSNLAGGVESVRFFSDEELAAAGVPEELLRQPDYVKAGAVLDDIDRFDASFFGFTPRVAEVTDPQQRIFLELVWQALEHAGCDPDSFPGSIGLFAGVSLNRYLLTHYSSHRELFSAVGGMATTLGNRTDHLCPMVAYKLNLRGPAVTVQTTCSTSLVAVHLACQSLLEYQCDAALAGGVRVDVPQLSGYRASEGGIESPDGHCRPFDARAQGTLGASGGGVVLLKRLSDALADGDRIYAVLRGSAINNDGSAKVGYTAPSIDGQTEVIAMAQAVSGVRPDDLDYIEAHGTATPMGDPIEVAALSRVFRAHTERRGFCGLGSVKSNFGHLDTAAGVASLIKVALSLEHGELPPSLNFERPNPELHLEESPFYVVDRLRPWKRGERTRLAGVSAFGIGGTNAHLVVEEAPEAEPSSSTGRWQILPLSARTPSALEAVTANLGRHLRERPELPLADVGHTLQQGRKAFEYRRAVIARDRDDAVFQLDALDPTRVLTSLREPRRAPVIFLFPGQGTQYPGMGRELYAAEPEVRRWVDHCAARLIPSLGLDLRRLLLAEGPEDGGEAPGASAEQLRDTRLAQPAIFVLEYALARLFESWGIEPEAMIGHSIGEYVAACLAGVFSLDDALEIVARRGELMASLPRGSMAAVHLPEAELLPRLGPDLSLAAVNRFGLCTVSGPEDAVRKLAAGLEEEGVVCSLLHTSHAFHSAMMEPILEPFTRRLAALSLQAPERPFISNLTGTWIRPEEATDPAYWARHLRSTVRFDDGVATLLREVGGAWLEVGPGQVLAPLVRRHRDKAPDQVVTSSMPHPKSREPEPAVLLAALGRLWMAGIDVDWQALHSGERRLKVPLPAYPFERRSYWLGDPDPHREVRRRANPADWFYVPSWRRLPAPVVEDPEAAVKSAGPWLVLVDDEGLGDALVAELQAAGGTVHRVEMVSERTVEPELAGPGDSRHRLPADDSAAWRTLLAELARRGEAPRQIVHLGTVTSAAPQAEREMRRRGFRSLLALARALGEAALAGEILAGDALTLTAVSSSMQDVVGGDLLHPEKATLLGPLKVLPKEYPGVAARSLDLVLPEAGGSRALLARQLRDELLAELVGGGEAPPVAALRGGRRWVESFESLSLPALGAEPAVLRRQGVYLITGGLGGVGLTLAASLARSHRARLVLTARRELPPRGEWESWCRSRPETDPIRRRIEAVRSLEALGAEVEVAAADVADEAAMNALLDRVRERFGALHGVFHAAGISPGGVMQLKTPEAADAVLAPKVDGTCVLARLLAREGFREELDVLVLFSSRSALFGPVASVDYTAANAYLDAFAAAAPEVRKLGAHTRVVAVNWCAFKEVGMLVEAAASAAGGESAAVRPRASEPAEVWESGEGEAEADYLLFDRRLSRGERDLYSTEFNVRTQWVVNEHRIAGNPVVPGTTYLEMARAAAARRGLQGPLELHDIFFLTPVRVREDDSRQVRFELEADADGGFRFLVKSRDGAGAGRPGDEHGWQQNMFGRIRPLESGGAPGYRDLEALRRRCGRRQVLVTLEDEQIEDFGPRWQNVTRVHIGAGEALGELELSAEYAGDLETMPLHPSLLDRAASIAERYLGELSGYLYLPMSYSSLRVWGPLPRRFYSHARLRPGSAYKNETLSFDLELLDTDGRVLVEIENYSKKRMNDPSERLRALGAGEGMSEALSPDALLAAASARETESSAAAERRRGYERALEGGVRPEEGMEVLRRLLGHGVSPRVVISPEDLTALLVAYQARPGVEAEEAAGAPKAVHGRPDLASAYAPPTSEVEERLAAIWGELLGVDRVGIHDNFIELGGDSVLAIQIIARAKQAGLEISPDQIFEFQTIAELAPEVGGGAAPTAAPAGEVSGEEIEAMRRILAAAAPPWADAPEEGVETETAEHRLGREAAKGLLETAARTHRARREELLLAALAGALGPSLGEREVAVEVETDGLPGAGHGEVFAAAAGPLPSLVAFLLPLAPGGAGERLAAVKESLRTLPGGGASYARLTAADDGPLTGLPRPGVRLLWRGGGGASAGESSASRAGLEMEVRPEADGLTLQARLRGTGARRALGPASELLRTFLRELESLTAGAGEAPLAPSDFPHADLDRGNLDRLSQLLSKADRGKAS